MKHTRTVMLLVLVATVACGCASEPSKSADPLASAKDKNLDSAARERAIDQLWQEGGTGDSRKATRESLKNIAWARSSGPPVRNHAIDTLANDPADTDCADTRKSMRLMLQTEKDQDVIAHIAELAAARGWKEFTPPLVRQYARVDRSVDEDKRPENLALRKLNPGQSIEQIAFDVFATPVTEKGFDAEHLQKCRDAAWEVLGRLDPTGARRLQMLAQLPAGSRDATVEDVQACLRDFKCVPLTASQLQWLRRMRTPQDKAKAAWWQKASSAIAGLDATQSERLAIRHAEPVRWAAANRPQWLRQTRDQLVADLAQRFKGRDTYTRSGAYGSDGNESLAYQADKMSWGDALAILVVDEAMKTKGLGLTAWKQAERDMKDTSTEYGGLLIAGDAEGGATPSSEPFTLALYPPRATQRFSDTRFVASEDMLAQAAVALAHYHFHAQQVENAEYTGPGPGDMEYALDQGATCVVLTPVRDGVLNADVYMAGGIRLDLGELKR